MVILNYQQLIVILDPTEILLFNIKIYEKKIPYTHKHHLFNHLPP